MKRCAALFAIGCGAAPLPPPPPVVVHPPPPPLELTVHVAQWCTVSYPDNVVDTELHLPANRRVILSFDGDVDVVIDGQTVHPPATLEIANALSWSCGPIALDYAAWHPLAREAQHPTTREGKIELAKQLYVSKGCAACHSLDGTPRVGPSWKGVWGTTVSDGNTERTFDLAFVRESVLTPLAFIANGYPATMPAYEGAITPEEIAALAVYIESLK